ncbi:MULTISPECIES: hypothetical protein [Tabrizicola]|uniref:hypothetical protein n=1 Tax=Tabrizicola TaxID=1443919 RepID=UPI0010805163|nr:MULTISPECIES: hypothetical protein [Paracoccaceae]
MVHRKLAVVLSLVCGPVLAEAVDLPYGFDGLYAPEGTKCGSAEMFVVKEGTMVGADSAIVVTGLVETPGVVGRVEATLFVRDRRGDRFDSAVITLDEDEGMLEMVFMDGMSLRLRRCE